MSKSLSILLPTYNCICTALVGELQRQCVAEGADFEIIVADDASPDKRFIAENRAIARLDGVRYIERERNVGRSAIRNYLVSQSSKEWILFIDGDLSLNNAQFIHNYLQAEGDVVVGGISTTPYNEEIKHYGFEDVLLGKHFKALNAHVNHIDNPVLFDDFEMNAVFLHKTEEALRTLSIFQTELKGYSNLLEMAEKLHRMHTDRVVAWLYKLLHKPLKLNLKGNNPNVFLFNIYKLVYFLHYNSIRK